MKKIKLPQGKFALVDDGDFEYLNKFKWRAIKNNLTFYVQRNIRLVNGKWTSIYMHRVLLNVPEEMETDHIDHCGLNNQRANLRICTHQKNMMNRNSNKNGSSEFKGVSWYKRDRKWHAQIRYKKKNYHLGYFILENNAALAYNKKAKELFGEFARLNKIIK